MKHVLSFVSLALLATSAASENQEFRSQMTPTGCIFSYKNSRYDTEKRRTVHLVLRNQCQHTVDATIYYAVGSNPKVQSQHRIRPGQTIDPAICTPMTDASCLSVTASFSAIAVSDNQLQPEITQQRPSVQPQRTMENVNDCEEYKIDALDKMIKVTKPNGTPYGAKPENFLNTRLRLSSRYPENCLNTKINHRSTVHESVCYAIQQYLNEKDKPYADLVMDNGSGNTYREFFHYGIESAKANAALAKAEICYACGRAGLEEITSGRTCQLTLKKQESAPVDNWETSPGIRK